MIFTLMRKYYDLCVYKLYDHAWLFIVILISALYAGGYLSMVLLEEQSIVENYTWYFIVTVTTVGYGDYSPSSSEGRVVASVIMLLGIGTIGLIIGKLSEFIIYFANKKTKGLGFMNCTDHILIMGYRKGSTEKVVEEIFATNPDEKIVLCSFDQESNPFLKDHIDFVRGDLSSEDVLSRSNAKEASQVVIHGSDDNQTFFAAYAFREINDRAHMVCFLSNEDHARKIRSLPAKDSSLNQVVLPANVFLMAQELQDRESSELVQQLLSNLRGENLYRYDIPENSLLYSSVEDIYLPFKKNCGASLIAIKDKKLEINPSLTSILRPGMAIFYTAPKRIDNLDRHLKELLDE